MNGVSSPNVININDYDNDCHDADETSIALGDHVISRYDVIDKKVQ